MIILNRNISYPISDHSIDTTALQNEVTQLRKEVAQLRSEKEEIEEKLTTEQRRNKHVFSIRDFKHDNAAMLFYTGLNSYEKFCLLRSFLGPSCERLTYYGARPTISVDDQIFLTLIRLRRHKKYFELSRLFDIPLSQVTSIFYTWVNFMSLELSEYPWWPSQHDTRFFAPPSFKTDFPSTRVIIDATEIPIKKPSKPSAQRSTYSTYKNKNTMKALIGTSPAGLVSFVSTAYGGSASDRQICQRSNLRTLLQPGDQIMADKGFNVQDLFEDMFVKINIPTFFSKMNRMTNQQVMRDRKISSKRVHVERVIGLAKTFTILTQPLTQWKLAC